MIIAVDIGGTQVRVALLDTKLNILIKKSFPTGIDSLPEPSCDVLIKETENLQFSFNDSAFKSVCISTPSFNRLTGKMVNPPNLPYWDDFSLLEFFETRLNLPVVVGNDASLAALGEYRSGVG